MDNQHRDEDNGATTDYQCCRKFYQERLMPCTNCYEEKQLRVTMDNQHRDEEIGATTDYQCRRKFYHNL